MVVKRSLRLRLKWSVFCLANLSGACTARVPVADTENGSMASAAATPSALRKINALAFNAYDLWSGSSGGKPGEEIVQPPSSYYQLLDGEPDGLFNRNYSETGFPGRSTKGLRVANGILDYPQMEGRMLKIKFFPQGTAKNQLDAMKECLSQGQRLPSLSELFDYCTHDTPASKEGEDPTDFYKKNRCRAQDRLGIWTFEVSAGNRSYGWFFDPDLGIMNLHPRMGGSTKPSRDGDFWSDLSYFCVGNE